MKIAVFTDVHGNRFALEAVLADIESYQPERMLNLGDMVLGGADPVERGAVRERDHPHAVEVSAKEE